MSDISDAPGTDVTSASSPAPESPTHATPSDSSAQTPAPSSSAKSDSTAPSSGDIQRSDREGLLAAVRSVVQDKLEPEKEALGDLSRETGTTSQDKDAPGQAGEDKAPPPDPQDKPQDKDEQELSEAELKKLKPETRKRFDRLLTQRNEARRAFDEVQPALRDHTQLTNYLREHQLAADDVNMLLGVGAALRRGDYQAFLNGVAPYVSAAQEALGVRLPPDLQAQVSDGLMTEEAARELTRNRHRATRAEAEVKQHTEREQQAGLEQRVEAVRREIDTWEMEIRRRDPDYPAKADAVRRIGQALLQERGPPQSPAEARQLVQAAYNEATTMLLKARPAPAATRRTPSGVHGTTQPAAEPRTMKEAALMALDNMRRAS